MCFSMYFFVNINMQEVQLIPFYLHQYVNEHFLCVDPYVAASIRIAYNLLCKQYVMLIDGFVYYFGLFFTLFDIRIDG